MSFFRGLWRHIRSLSKKQWAFGGIAAVVLVLVGAGVIYGWDYTNSPTFCGTTCHTMPPEYNAYQVSPHARVNCVECHLGRDIVTTTFGRKAGDLMHVVRYATHSYSFPLFAEAMLPARESCEKCHWPEKFADDRAVTIKHYQNDQNNTQIVTFLLLKTGGGTSREGLGLGIHWHIENQVYFIATDDQKQNIPWVQVVDASGKTTTYVDIQNPLPQNEIDKAQKHRMDCIDCHNRVSHTFLSPTQAMDQALSLNRVDTTIPYIKKKAVEVLSATYTSSADANKAIEALDGFYQQNYPDYYRSKSLQVKDAITYLKTLYPTLVYPDQELSWNTHPDNLGHKDWPGCFRCHDGKHFTSDNKQAIRLECNICHSLPEVSTPGGPAPVISLVAANEPASHKTTTWLAQHRTAFNATCQECHDTNNAGGSDNSSFCSNSACHGTNWRFAGLDAPALAKIFPPPAVPAPRPNVQPAQIPHPIGGNPDCQICHGINSKVRPYPSDHVGRTNDVCLACHKPSLSPNTTNTGSGTPSASAGGPPSIPHDTAGRTQCLGCHDNPGTGAPQVPQFHKDAKLGNDQCLSCHKPGASAKPTATAQPAASVPASQLTPGAAETTAQPTTSAQATTAPQPAATPTIGAQTTSASPSGGPPRIPADHAGRTGCLMCHATGVGGAPQVPADHAGRTEDTCKMCHQGP